MYIYNNVIYLLTFSFSFQVLTKVSPVELVTFNGIGIVLSNKFNYSFIY